MLTYDTANATGTGEWKEAYAKAQEFVAKLTIDEKADMVTGQPGPCVGNIVAIPRLGFPGLCLQDGPLAIRVADYASVFAAGVTVASTWDRDLLYERGYAMGQSSRPRVLTLPSAPWPARSAVLPTQAETGKALLLILT